MAKFTGTDAAEELAGANGTKEVDALIKGWVKDGSVPSYLKDDDWPSLTIKNATHTLKVLVAPDYAAVGTDSDPFVIGRSSPYLAQWWADYYDAIMPSGKLLMEIERAASPKLVYTDVKGKPYFMPTPKIETPVALENANKMRKAAMDAAGVSPRDGNILIGYRKTMIVRPRLDGKFVAIFGGRWNEAGVRVQPHSGGAHPPTYSDYSHGIVLVSRKAVLDGSKVDLVDDVFLSKDPTIWGLVSDEGRFNPNFPNADVSSGADLAPAAIAAQKAPGGGAAATSTTAKLKSYAPAVALGAAMSAGGVLLGFTMWPVAAAGVAGAVIGRLLTRS